jgi:hypothetical protein
LQASTSSYMGCLDERNNPTSEGLVVPPIHERQWLPVGRLPPKWNKMVPAWLARQGSNTWAIYHDKRRDCTHTRSKATYFCTQTLGRMVATWNWDMSSEVMR